MTAFDYRNCPYPISEGKRLAHREAWQKIAAPGRYIRARLGIDSFSAALPRQ